MPPSSRFYDLAHRRLAGTASAAEQQELRLALDADPALRERFAALENIWRTASATPRTRGFDVEGAWLKLRAQLPSASAAPTPNLRSYALRYARLVAAALVVVGFGAWWLAKTSMPPSPARDAQEIVWDTYESAANRLTVIVLGDGTRIHLSKQSKLRYPKVAAIDRREVFLEGEAYFEVATDPRRPFSVHAPGLVTTVLGTTFNVRAFPEETTRAISLLTGSIEVARTGGTAGSTPERLSPGQQMRFEIDQGGHEIRAIDAPDAIGWMRDRLAFKDEPLESLARALTRKFDVATDFASPELRRIPITADFQGQDLATILELVHLTTGLSCDLQPRTGQPVLVTFRPPATRR